MKLKKIIGFFKLIRFELPVAAGICVVLGQLLALKEFYSFQLAAKGFLSVFAASASILVLNDYFDVETDRINAPYRPIPFNLVTEKEALYFSIFLLIIGFATSLLIDIYSFFCILVLTVVGYLYNRRFKKSGLLGNVIVSFSVGMTFIYGGISVGSPYDKHILFFALTAALIDLGEEIASDAMDIKGDLLIGSNSLAIKYGRPVAVKVSTIIFLFVILFSFLPFFLSWFSAVYLIPILVMDAFILFPILKLNKIENDDSGRNYIRIIYLGSTFGILLFITILLLGA